MNDKIKAYKLFANKIWNATRFVLEKTENVTVDESMLTPQDATTLATWRSVQKDIHADFDAYRLHLASEKVYAYFWHTFCDVVIEDCKKRIADGVEVHSAQQLLRLLLVEQLHTLHPFMPFITGVILAKI